MARITCPQCSASYDVADGSLGPAGRKVRCASCQTTWRAVEETGPPPPPAPASTAARDRAPAFAGIAGVERVGFEAPTFVPPPATIEGSLPPPAGGLSIEEAARRKSRKGAAPKPKAKPGAAGAGIGLGPVRVSAGAIVVATTLGLFVSAIVWRDTVARVVPTLAGLYELAGLEVNVRGLVFDTVATSHDTDGGQPVIVIEGRVRNITSEPITMSRLRVALVGATGSELRGWTIPPPRTVIGPREVVAFRSRAANPPRDATHASVRFATPRDQRVSELAR